MDIQTFSRRKLLFSLVAVTCGSGIVDLIISISNRIKPRGIVVHHSALPNNEALNQIRELHARRGFKIFYWYHFFYIGYHYIIRANGEIIPIRPERLRGAHARGFNDMIGICVLGNFDSSAGIAVPTVLQMRSLNALCKYILTKYHFQIRDIHKHSEVDTYTVCPGDHFPFDQLLQFVQNSD